MGWSDDSPSTSPSPFAAPSVAADALVAAVRGGNADFVKKLLEKTDVDAVNQWVVLGQ